LPVVFRVGRFRFFFYANEGSPLEPPHVHVEQGGREAKIWLRPDVRVAYNDGFSAKTLREVLDLVTVQRERAERAWHDFFG
jgi:hypothetical protein